jgi:hypothetical protein
MDRARALSPSAGGSGKLPDPITWHTTLLAEVGPNAEGPLPWLEREYTPISTAKEWEQGKCELLVKVYANGAATSWLAAAAPPASVWLSKPTRTLSVPFLIADGRAFRPASVLLLLGGTGVVALPQILQHREPTRQLGISTPRRDQLRVPVDAVVSFREDDALLVPQLAQWCRDGGDERGVRQCTVLLTSANACEPPFPDAPTCDDAESALHGLANARVLRTRLSSTIVSEAYARMPRPCRVVVSGPGAFNTVASRMLAEIVDDEESVTVLSA